MKSQFFRLLFALVLATAGSVALRAQDPAIKARIEARLGSVDAMKGRGAAGENNRGFLEARPGATGDDNRIIGEENADRRAVYAAIAAQTKANADQVGQKRAQQLASLARPG